MKRIICLIVFVAVAVIGLLNSASASIFVSRAAFEAANPGLTTIDFEGIVPVGDAIAPVPVFPGVTISGVNPVIAEGAFFGAPSDWLADDSFGGFLVTGFSPTVNAVGFEIAADFADVIDGPITVEIYNGATLLESTTFFANDLSVFDTFMGFSDYGQITDVFIYAHPDDFVNIDNLSFGNSQVPEPTTLLIWSVFAGTGLILGKRRRS